MGIVNIPVEPAITEYLHRKASGKRIPLNGTFELTPLCNMNCKMCYVRMTKEEQEKVRPLRTAKEWLDLGEEAKKRGMLYLLLTGGEPFLRHDFQEIMQGLHKMGFIISINSNATLIDEKVVEWLKHTPPARMNITLYGASDETYARLCGNPKGFTQTVRAIHFLKQAGISVKINCSATPYNVGDLEQIFEFCKKEQLIVQATSYMFPPTRRDAGMIGKNERFSPEEAAFQAARIESFMNGDKAFLEKMKQNKPIGFPDDIEEGWMEGEGDCMHCRAGKCSFWVTWEGKMYPCGMMPVGGINVFEDGMERAWQYIVKNVNGIRLPPKCNSCPVKTRCRACAAMVITESGNYETAPQYRCEMMKAYPKACERMQKILEERAGVHEEE